MKKIPTDIYQHQSTQISDTMHQTIKARSDAKRTMSEKFADWVTLKLGSMTFLIVNVSVFLIWILINTNSIPGVSAFDAFPFSLLTTIVSLEAIVLAIVVLVSQNRNIRVDDLREELHLQVNLIAEKEITQTMKMVALLLEKNGVDISEDADLKKFLKPVVETELEESLEKEILQ